jgi:predicted nucleic acid-binding protein
VSPAVADLSILTAFARLDVFWVLLNMFQPLLVCPTAQSRMQIPTGHTLAELSEIEVEDALKFRSKKIWDATTTAVYRRMGLASDTAETIALGKHRRIVVLTDSEACLSYNREVTKLPIMPSIDILERASKSGLLDEALAVRIYNEYYPQKLNRPNKAKVSSGRKLVQQLAPNPIRQVWAPAFDEQVVTLFEPQPPTSKQVLKQWL